MLLGERQKTIYQQKPGFSKKPGFFPGMPPSAARLSAAVLLASLAVNRVNIPQVQVETFAFDHDNADFISHRIHSIKVTIEGKRGKPNDEFSLSAGQPIPRSEVSTGKRPAVQSWKCPHSETHGMPVRNPPTWFKSFESRSADVTLPIGWFCCS